ncbi:energy transducer TonB [Vannielia sp.]|uniref:energy transducer TonB family protein n=1 Tax=Vannielia sp. TaxID=2813045 RepID=UPI002624A79A|nr:energy transducer TonB [Vannielia sp.]MDF1871585.1 energy transducer TonB [Vannielia sp.]
MIRLIEGVVFTALSGVVLAFGVARFTPAELAGSGGLGGAEDISIKAASAQLAAMVADWDRPPDVSLPDGSAPSPPTSAAMAMPPRTDTLPNRPDLTALPQVAAPEAPPRPSTAPPPKPVRPAAPAKAPPAPAKKAKAAKKPQPPAAPSAKRRAAGQGGSTAAGQGKSQAAAGLSAAQEAKLAGQWGSKLRRKIAGSKRSPGGSGRVVLQIYVAPDGKVRGVGVARSSGSPALDRAAIDAVRRAGRMPRAPKGLAKASYTFSLPIDFN